MHNVTRRVSEEERRFRNLPRLRVGFLRCELDLKGAHFARGTESHNSGLGGHPLKPPDSSHSEALVLRDSSMKNVCLIDVAGFHKAYDDVVAVSGLTFQVQSGQILGLVGPNGAGKTTTMRAISGIFPASRGRLSIAGFDVLDQPVETKRRLAYVPDDPQLFADLTVEQHLAFTSSVFAVPDATQRANQLLARFDLGAKRHSRAADLSRGMRQKLAICCAYLYDPLVILCDEPLTGLDPLGIRTLKQSLLERAQAGAAVIVSSHLLAMVEDVCTDVLILDKGTQKFWGSIEDLKSTYADDVHSASLEDIFFRATESTAC